MTNASSHPPSDAPAPARRFFGWAVLPAVGYSLFVGAGLIFYAMSVLLQALIAETGYSVAQISAANTIFLLVGGLAGIAVGELIARFDIRWTVSTGTLLVALSYWLLPSVSSLGEIYAAYVLLALGYAMTALIPATTLVARWFVRRRALALALTQSGLSLGGIILTPLLAAALDGQGLTALRQPIFIIIILANIPLCLWLMRPEPAAMGQSPDGDVPTPDTDGGDGMAAQAALRTRFFRFAVLAAILALMAQVGTIAHLYNWALERADAEAAAGMVAVLALASFLGRLICGALLDRLDLFRFALTLYLAQAGVLVLIAFAQGNMAAAAASFAFGLTVGNILMLQPLLIGAAFGLRDYPRLLSYFQLLMNFGVAAGPIFIGLVYDFAGGYRTAFLAMAVAAIGGALSMLRAGAPKNAAQAGG